jgi:hypothetical protein
MFPIPLSQGFTARQKMFELFASWDGIFTKTYLQGLECSCMSRIRPFKKRMHETMEDGKMSRAKHMYIILIEWIINWQQNMVIEQWCF